MALAWVIKIDNIKFRWNLIAVSVLEQMVVSDNRQVVKLKIIYIERVGFLYSLLYKLVDNGIGLPGVPNTIVARKILTRLINPL